jgi:hypothetical protein
MTTTITQAQTVDTRIGKLEFEQGVPTLPTVKNLYDEMDFQRACQLFLWRIRALSAARPLGIRIIHDFKGSATTPLCRNFLGTLLTRVSTAQHRPVTL